MTTEHTTNAPNIRKSKKTVKIVNYKPPRAAEPVRVTKGRERWMGVWYQGPEGPRDTPAPQLAQTAPSTLRQTWKPPYLPATGSFLFPTH